MLTQGSNLQHKAFSSFGHLSDLLEAELPPSLVANRGERAKRVTFIARETSGNEAETDGDGTWTGPVSGSCACQHLPSRLKKNYNSQPENFCILIHGQSETQISSGGKIKAS